MDKILRLIFRRERRRLNTESGIHSGQNWLQQSWEVSIATYASDCYYKVLAILVNRLHSKLTEFSKVGVLFSSTDLRCAFRIF